MPDHIIRLSLSDRFKHKSWWFPRVLDWWKVTIFLKAKPTISAQQNSLSRSVMPVF